MKRSLLCAALLFMSGVGALRAAAPDTSIAALLSRAGERAALAGVDAIDAGTALTAIVGERHPIACASPLIQSLERAATLPPALQRMRAAIASRPAFAEPRFAASRDGAIVVHFDAASAAGLMAVEPDAGGRPGLIDRLVEALQASLSYVAAQHGFAPAGPVDVYVTRLGGGIEGYTALDAALPSPGAPFIVLDADLATDRVLTASLHQVAHAALRATDSRAEVWWTEATASYLTLAGTGDYGAYSEALRLRLQSAGRGLAADDLPLMQGALLWPMFLAERTGDPAIVRRVWSEGPALAGDVAAATDAALRKSAGTTLAAAFREFAAWLLFTGGRDDGRHYAAGRALPEATLHTVGPDLPVRLGPVEPIEPLGSVAFRLPADGQRGSLLVDVRSDGGSPAADLLIFYRSAGPLPVLVPLSIGDDGRGRAAVPWSDARQAWILLRNDAATEATRFDVEADLDAAAPYDLAALAARPSGRALVVEWTTASERGLLGWNVHRAESARGPFVRLNEVAVPAYGDGEADTGYVFIDETAIPGRRYYYAVEGLTLGGLAERSHAVSARAAAPR